MASSSSSLTERTSSAPERAVKFQPPSYVDTSSSPQYPSISDLRAQIIANASILMPQMNDHTTSDDHLEVVTGKITNPGAPINNERLRNLQASSMGQHYALLVKRTTKKEIRVIIRGEPHDTVLDAMQWMLEETEIRIDEMARRYGKDAKGNECLVM